MSASMAELQKLAPNGVAFLPLQAYVDELARRTAIWKPQAGPQTEAFASPAYITGYGGAAGGG